MRYNSREEVERIGQAGVYHYGEGSYLVARQMSSYWLCVSPDDAGYVPHALNDGYWEAWITLWMSRNVIPGSVCIDVGANFGFYTFFLAQHGCRVYGFDPSLVCINLLRRSCEINGASDRVILENYAVSDGTVKELELWKVEGHMMNTSIKENSSQPETSFMSKAISLDQYFTEHQDNRNIDFVKIDAEGSEQLIWNGMKRLLEDNPECVVLMEFVPDLYEDNGRPFLNQLIEERAISYVDYAGDEQELLHYNFFETDTEPFRMLVLRNRK